MCRALVHVGAVEAFDDMEFFSLLFYLFHLCSTCVPLVFLIRLERSF